MIHLMKGAAQQQGAEVNTDYRDACITSGAVGLWMLDEPAGNNVALDQGTAGVNGAYLGRLTNADTRGQGTGFNIALAGASSSYSRFSTRGFRAGVVLVPSNSAWATALQVTNGAMTFEWVGVIDRTHDSSAGYQSWMYNSASGFSPNQGPMFKLREELTTSATAWLYQSFGSNYNAEYKPTKQTYGQATHNVVFFNSAANHIRWYRNGSLVGTKNVYNTKQINGSAASILIGNSTTSATGTYGYAYSGIWGRMGGVAVYNKALSSTEVTAHYNALLT